MKAKYRLIGRAVRETLSERIVNDPELDDHEVVIRPHKSSRSLDQNDYMWRLLRAAALQVGYSPEELHEVCKDAYGGHSDKWLFGREVRVLNFSSSKANIEEMRHYLDWLEPYLSDNTGIDPRQHQ